MGYFFQKPPSVSKTRTNSNKKIKLRDTTKADMNRHGCKLCPLDRARLRHGKMEPTGDKLSDIYILGEAPGEEEDKEGEQFIGVSGQIIRKAIRKSARDKYADEECRWNNTIRCHPPKNRNPALNEIECCRGFIDGDIQDVKPYAVVGTGNIPLKAYAGVDTISNWRGLRLPIKIGDHVCWYNPIFHPSYVYRNRRKDKYTGETLESEMDLVFQHDMDRVLEWLEEGKEPEYRGDWSKQDHLKGIDWVMGEGNSDLVKVEKWLEEMADEPRIGFDWETTALRPYDEGSRILTLGISTEEKGYAFPCDHPKAWSPKIRKRVMQMVEEFIYNSKTKVAHNLEFELEWAAFFFGEDLLWETEWCDTYAYSYSLDGRKKIHSLDSLCRRYFGFWLKDLSNVNLKDMINQPLVDVLPYNALDARYTSLMLNQLEDDIRLPVNEGLEDVAQEIIRTSSSIVYTQLEGVKPNWPEYHKFKEEFAQRREELEKKVKRIKEVKQYEKIYGSFNPGSNDNVKVLLRDILNRKEGYPKSYDGKYNFKGKYKVDESVLSSIPKSATKFPSIILELRQVNKLDSTYCGVLEGHVFPDDRIRAQYKTKWVSTLRTACEDPNMQNWPQKKRKDLRGMIRAPKGYWMYCLDYGAIQGRAIAMMSKDKQFCDALWHKLDVHGKWAENIQEIYPKVTDLILRDFDLDPKNITEEKARETIRFAAKNRIVFPFFFGSSKKSVIKNMFLSDRAGNELYDWFWDTYAGVKEWQDNLKGFYSENGYVASLAGSRRREPMGYNELINSPIQGVERDIVLDAWNRTSEEGFRTIIEVHDDLSFYLPKGDEGDEMADEIAELMCLPDYDWVNVPIVVEVTRGDTWYDQEDWKEFTSEQFGHTTENSTAGLLYKR